MLSKVKGSVLDAREDIIVNNVNCLGLMEEGLSKEMKSRHPQVFYQYNSYIYRFIKEGKTADDLLGRVFFTMAPDGTGKVIANIFGQKFPGRAEFSLTERVSNQEALFTGLRSVQDLAINNEMSIAIPFNLGCEPHETGNWDSVLKEIETIFDKTDIVLYQFKK